MNGMKFFFLSFALAFSGALHAATIDEGAFGKLSKLAPASTLSIDAFPISATETATIRFEHVEIYAHDAHLYEVTASGPREVPRSTFTFLRGYSEDGNARVALTLDSGRFVDGGGSGPDGSFLLRAADSRRPSTLAARSVHDLLPPGFHIDFRCGNENDSLSLDPSHDLGPQLHSATQSPTTATATSHALRLATVAVDTDNPFMLKLFNNSSTSATAWIASMFNTMNLMYERDLLVRLVIGTSYYQTLASDPYTSMTASGTTLTSMKDNLNIFSNYWMNNHPAGSPSRTFAILLSGLLPSTSNSCSASGIAWINAYCKTGTVQPNNSTFGSYSVNQVCTSTNPGFGPAFSALLVGHEIGHNFGAYHTHCTDKTNGTAQVSSNTIDVCFNGEGATHTSGGLCYDGAESCPVSGPGAPAGTIMSYCNVDLGCGATQQNVLQFHPTQIDATNVGLLARVNAAPAGCLNNTDDIFFSLFE